MILANVEKSNQLLYVRRLNTSYVADLKSGVKFWLMSLLFFSGFHFLTVALNWVLRWTGSTPLSAFPTMEQMLPLVALMAFGIAVNLVPDFGLISSQEFRFDRVKNAFSVDNRYVSDLDKISIRLQDGFGPSRRAFRLIVTAWGSNYVIVQTRRFTTATLTGKEYSYVVTSESQQRKYWFHQWADYIGVKTGFSSKWPEYQEIFALYAELTQFVEVSKDETSQKAEQS